MSVVMLLHSFEPSPGNAVHEEAVCEGTVSRPDGVDRRPVRCGQRHLSHIHFGHRRDGSSCAPETCGGSRLDPCIYSATEIAEFERLEAAESVEGGKGGTSQVAGAGASDTITWLDNSGRIVGTILAPARVWKPGDVAMVQNEHGVWNRAIFTVAGHWQFGVSMTTADASAQARELVVIDLDDHQQLTHLLDEYYRTGTGGIRSLTKALRGMFERNPPEPTGLGAVVEVEPMNYDDGTQRTITRLTRGEDGLWWSNGDGGWSYDFLRVARVLSEGVAVGG